MNFNCILAIIQKVSTPSHPQNALQNYQAISVFCYFLVWYFTNFLDSVADFIINIKIIEFVILKNIKVIVAAAAVVIIEIIKVVIIVIKNFN